ncbi:ABC transporter ATP-binding protein/permease [Acidiferrobacter sp.]|uniref:ABCB family ABC transporter ATP-binding protein/permease n=1 Tax=Acidiferrobacter sp. TaxID=1872107 RepID=UPI00262D23C3|nr:ABC transporter ATP-binding protein/permease [Acidiferrobacter sp.]
MRGLERRTADPPAESARDTTASRGRLWSIVKRLAPYLWEYRLRVAVALVSLTAAKAAGVAVPWVLKDIINQLDSRKPLLIVPVALIAAYGALRFANALFGELRDLVFARVKQRAVRRAATDVFRHLHALPLAFHLDRQTGAVARDIERGSRGIALLLNILLFHIIPTVVEIALVAGILIAKFRLEFALITFMTLAVYALFTLIVTEWRTVFRRSMNDMDSRANSHAVESLLNYETVKFFANEDYEWGRYDSHLAQWEDAAVRNQSSLAVLNTGQSAIVAFGVGALMLLAAQGVADHRMNIGDLVLVNAFLIQLFMPLHFLGAVYREIKHSLTDMEKMFALIDVPCTIADAPGAGDLVVSEGLVRFEHVDFSYGGQPLLDDVDFTVAPRSTTAIVGPSGSGKSTIMRLLVRFYDPDSGSIRIDGHDIRAVTQHSLRRSLGVVPQDPVLFNDSLYTNIAYGRPGAPLEEVRAAASLAHLDGFITGLPQGYETRVGERGLKLSGGEKQRVAIARALLKEPQILLFDEATSALDAASERAVQEGLTLLAGHRTTIVVAHRLATIQHADQILVMRAGRIVERGRHRELIAQGGLYAQLWALQQEGDHAPAGPAAPVPSGAAGADDGLLEALG